MNLNKLAKEISIFEGKKVQVSIAQIKEVMKILLTELALLDAKEVESILRRYRGKTGK